MSTSSSISRLYTTDWNGLEDDVTSCAYPPSEMSQVDGEPPTKASRLTDDMDCTESGMQQCVGELYRLAINGQPQAQSSTDCLQDGYDLLSQQRQQDERDSLREPCKKTFPKSSADVMIMLTQGTSDCSWVEEEMVPVPGSPVPSQAVVGEPQAVVGEPQAAFGQPQAVVGQPQAVVGEPQAVVGQPQAVVGQPQAVVGQPQAAVGQPPAIDPIGTGGAVGTDIDNWDDVLDDDLD